MTSTYISNDIRPLYQGMMNHLSPHLQGYAAVGAISYRDILDIRATLDATGPDRDARLTSLADRLFPGQGGLMMSTPENRQSLTTMLGIAADPTVNGAFATSFRFYNGNQPVNVGMLHLSELDNLEISSIRHSINNFSDRPPRREDIAILVGAHEVGHLVQSIQTGQVIYDPRRTPPVMDVNAQISWDRENYADTFMRQQMPGMASAGIVTNGNIGLAFEQSRQLEGIGQMFRTGLGLPYEYSHATSLLGGGQRLTDAAREMSLLWRDAGHTPRDASDANVHTFLQQIRNRPDISADARELARIYIDAHQSLNNDKPPAPSKMTMAMAFDNHMAAAGLTQPKTLAAMSVTADSPSEPASVQKQTLKPVVPAMTI